MSPRMRTRRDGSARPRRHRALQPASLLWLTVLWLLLWGDVSPWLVLSGVLVAVAVSLTFPLPPVALGIRVRPWRMLRMLTLFLLDIVRASVQVSAVVLRRRPVRNSIVGLRLRSESDFVLTGVGAMLSLVPGSIVVEARRSTHTLYLHVLDAQTEEQVAEFLAHARVVEDRFVDAWGLDGGEAR